MMKNLNTISVERHAVPVEEKVVPGLKRFVKNIKSNLWNQIKGGNISPATVQSAEMLQKKFSEWGSHRPDLQSDDESGTRLYMDYLLHHRVSLATEIVKSMADGQSLSRKREKVLKNSIEYIEQSL